MDKPLDSTRYLLGRAMLVEERIRTLVAHRRGHDPAPDDPFRGLYLSDEVVDALLAHAAPPPEAASQAPCRAGRSAPTPPRPTAWNCGCAPWRASASLSEQDVEFLVICLLPDLDTPVRAALRLSQRRRHTPPGNRGAGARAVGSVAVERGGTGASGAGRTPGGQLVDSHRRHRPALPDARHTRAGSRHRPPSR